ncbi:MAG: hypothetical protein OEU36_01110 [Gammaproteobacteria bacterium]|jgi:hypothetical protein|nr:hypothetical protein [Gammaproteobacteria bacterium]
MDIYDTTQESRLLIPALGGFYRVVSDLAYPPIRFVADAMLIPHVWMKIFGGALAGTAQAVLSHRALDATFRHAMRVT